MNKVKNIFLIILLMFSSSSFADAWSAYSTIKSISMVQYTTPVVFVKHTSGFTNPNGCSVSGYAVLTGSTDFNILYASLLSAKADDQRVAFVISGNQCVRDRAVIKGLIYQD